MQTFIFEKNQKIVNSNYLSFEQLLSKLNTPIKIESNTILWKNVHATPIIDFLLSYQQNYHNTEMLSSYIGKQNEIGVLNNWSVALILNSRKSVTAKGKLEGLDTKSNSFIVNNEVVVGGLLARNFKDGKELRVNDGKNAILDKRSRKIDLNLNEQNPSEGIIKSERNRLQQPLLVLMPFDPRISGELDHKTPLIGFGIIIPEFKDEIKVEFAARKVEFDVDYSQEDDDIGDDY